MNLDELLKQNAAWLEQAKKRRVFDKVDDKSIKFPDEQRERRMAEIKTRIENLVRRKEDAAAAYDRAIAIEKAEYEALKSQKPLTPPDEPVRPDGSTGKKSKAKKSQKPPTSPGDPVRPAGRTGKKSKPKRP